MCIDVMFDGILNNFHRASVDDYDAIEYEKEMDYWNKIEMQYWTKVSATGNVYV